MGCRLRCLVFGRSVAGRLAFSDEFSWRQTGHYLAWNAGINSGANMSMKRSLSRAIEWT
jgi:hypothetical protein